MKRYFITGTGTGIGKTVFSALFAKELLGQGLRVRYVKPVATGYPEDDDASWVAGRAGLGAGEAVTLYTAAEPASPCFVFDPFPFAECVARIEAAAEGCDALLVESAGGLAVPLGQRRYNYHFALELGLETILVVPNQLGCLSDAIVYGHFAKRHKLALTAIAINDHFAASPREGDRNAAVIAGEYPSQTIYRYDTALSVLA